MKVTSYAVARPAYYDRNAVGYRQHYNATIAPHTFTVRWTATIAAGKKAYIEGAFCYSYGYSLATTVGLVWSYVETDSGGNTNFVTNAGFVSSLTVYQLDKSQQTIAITMYAGDTINGKSYNASVGGSVNHIIDASYTLFDAQEQNDVIVRLKLIGSGTQDDPYRIDLPTYSGIVTNETTGRAFADVPVSDVPADVAAFVAAYPTVDLTTPLPVPFPPALANAWAEFLARRYDLGSAKWHPVVF